MFPRHNSSLAIKVTLYMKALSKELNQSKNYLMENQN